MLAKAPRAHDAVKRRIIRVPAPYPTPHPWLSIRERDQWLRGNLSGCVGFSSIDFFFFLRTLLPLDPVPWMRPDGQAGRNKSSPLKRCQAAGPRLPGALAAEESFVLRLWPGWKKIPAIRLCSVAQACRDGEALTRNVVFGKSRFKSPRSVLHCTSPHNYN